MIYYMTKILILPGIGNSGPDHWQTRWEKYHPSFQRVEQDEWEAPHCSDWVRRLEEVVTTIPEDVILVAHSSACALVVHWTRQSLSVHKRKIRGALLVAPSDPKGANYPIGPSGFDPVPMEQLPFRSIVVASTNDKYVTSERAAQYAAAWHSRLVILENAGHINSGSGLGDWLYGLELLKEIQDIG